MSNPKIFNNTASWTGEENDKRKSGELMQFSDSTENLIEHHHEDVIDAMGLISDESTSYSVNTGNENAPAFNDNRRFSDIPSDQKMIRPIKTASRRPKDAFTQQSNLLSHRADRYGIHHPDKHYGSTSNSNNIPSSNPIPFPIPTTHMNNPMIPNKRSTAQRSLLSQSAPISMADSYLGTSPPKDDSIYPSSNPSSRRTSDASSLNDVCFPVDSLDEVDRSKKWPNLSVLEEFAEEEREGFSKVVSSSVSQKSASTIENNVNFQYPIVSSIDHGDMTTPLIVSTNEEIDPINGRLRPKRNTPWNKPEFVTHHDKLSKFRFTYFREDMPNTIHSPSISGLLHDGRKFEDLFSPSSYTSVETKTSEEKDTSNTVHRTTTVPSVSSIPVNSNVDISAAASTIASKPFIQPFWLDVLNPTEEEMKAISKTFGIHPLTSEDIFLGEAREKIELFRDYYFICFTSFDVEEEHQKRQKAAYKAFVDAIEEENLKTKNDRSLLEKIFHKFMRRSSATSHSSRNSVHSNSSRRSRRSLSDNRKSSVSVSSRKPKKKKYNKDDLIPLPMYIVVFKDAVITFHFKPTPHTGNVRRRARMLRDYLTMSSDWIGYALIDDITDAFGPLMEAIESEVNSIEDEIIRMQSTDNSDSEFDSDDSDDDKEDPVWIKLKRRNSNIAGDKDSIYTTSSSLSKSTSSSSENTKIISWKKKGDMLRRIGDCRRRVMSMLRLLGSKADVIKISSKRYNEQREGSPRSEISLYLGDIHDHIVTMVQNLNHYEKLLARSHSNYLAQINIDMTKVNNDMNDILGKITILGTIVLPLNIVTGLWGMNCLVPGQERDDLAWFWMIVTGMIIFSVTCYFYVKKLMNLV